MSFYYSNYDIIHLITIVKREMLMKVSIIVPVYNSSSYLESCLQSLMNQTLDEIEVFAIDDASTDNSLSILREYEKKYPNRLRVLQNEQNLGQSATRNRGIKIAQGEYIGFLDSDDYVNYTMYQTMYEGAKENDYPEVIVTGLCFVKDDSYLENNFSFMQSRKGIIKNVLDNPSFVLDQSPSVCNKLFRRDTLQEDLFLEGKMWEDVAFSFAKMFNADRILHFQNSDYFYRRRMTDGVSSKGYQINSHLLDIFSVADQIEQETKKHNRYDRLKEQIQFIQVVTCLQRVVEVMSWPILDSDKNILCQLMNNLIIEKYGDWRALSVEELSSRVGFLEIEKLKQLVVEENSSVIELEKGIVEELQRKSK